MQTTLNSLYIYLLHLAIDNNGNQSSALNGDIFSWIFSQNYSEKNCSVRKSSYGTNKFKAKSFRNSPHLVANLSPSWWKWIMKMVRKYKLPKWDIVHSNQRLLKCSINQTWRIIPFFRLCHFLCGYPKKVANCKKMLPKCTQNNQFRLSFFPRCNHLYFFGSHLKFFGTHLALFSNFVAK